jgi:ATP-dependent Clp protease adapter protein ClpS
MDVLRGILASLIGPRSYGPRLDRLLARIRQDARRARRNTVGDLDLLRAIIRESDVAEPLRGFGVDLGELDDDLQRFLVATAALVPAGRVREPAFDPNLMTVLQLADLLREGRGSSWVEPIDALLAIVRAAGLATSFLADRGVTPYAFLRFLAHGERGPYRAPQAPPGLEGQADDDATVDIVVMNDPFTPMYVVTDILEAVLGMTREDARVLMLSIHEDGSGRAGPFFLSDAERRARTIEEWARRLGLPLKATLVDTSATGS